MHRMFSACASADNILNNPALLLICAEMVWTLFFEFEFLNFKGQIDENTSTCPGQLREVVIKEVCMVSTDNVNWVAFMSYLQLNVIVREKDVLSDVRFIHSFKIIASKIDDIPWTQAAEVSWAAPTPHPPAHTSGCSSKTLPPTQLEAIKKKYDPARSLFPLHTAEHLSDANKVCTSRSSSLSPVSVLRRQSFHPLRSIRKMYNSFVRQYYRITGSANQIRSVWICLRSRGRGNQLSLSSDESVTFFFVCLFFTGHIFGLFVILWWSCTSIPLYLLTALERFMGRTMSRLRFLQHEIISQITNIFPCLKTHETRRGTTCLMTGCVSALGRCAIHCLPVNTLAWPLNSIKCVWVLLLSDTCIQMPTHLHILQMGGRIRLAHTHTHTLMLSEIHKSFPQQEAKSMPNTPHWFYLHGFWCRSEALWRWERFSSFCESLDTHMHTQIIKCLQMTHTYNTGCRCATFVKLKLMLPGI